MVNIRKYNNQMYAYLIAVHACEQGIKSRLNLRHVQVLSVRLTIRSFVPPLTYPPARRYKFRNQPSSFGELMRLVQLKMWFSNLANLATVQ